MGMLKYPLETTLQGGTEISYQQPRQTPQTCEWAMLEADLVALVKLSDCYSPGP